MTLEDWQLLIANRGPLLLLLLLDDGADADVCGVMLYAWKHACMQNGQKYQHTKAKPTKRQYYDKTTTEAERNSFSHLHHEQEHDHRSVST